MAYGMCLQLSAARNSQRLSDVTQLFRMLNAAYFHWYLAYQFHCATSPARCAFLFTGQHA